MLLILEEFQVKRISEKINFLNDLERVDSFGYHELRKTMGRARRGNPLFILRKVEKKADEEINRRMGIGTSTK